MWPHMINEKYGTALRGKLSALLEGGVNNRKSNLGNFTVLLDLLSQSTTFAIFPLKWPTVVIFPNINVTTQKVDWHGSYTQPLLFLLRNGPPLSSFSTLAWQNRKEIEVAPSVDDRKGNESILTVWCALCSSHIYLFNYLFILLTKDSDIWKTKTYYSLFI